MIERLEDMPAGTIGERVLVPELRAAVAAGGAGQTPAAGDQPRAS